jgi:DUF1365 family protein
MFYLDLDELDSLSRKIYLLSHNRWNIFNFRDSDHLDLGGLSVKENISKYLEQKGLAGKAGRIMLLTNLRTVGYIFNPVSFYYCFDLESRPLCVVAEIGNTFGELKPFFLGPQESTGGIFDSQQKKYFYISPFVELDIPMHFRIGIPGEGLNIKIDDIKDGEKFLYTMMSGLRIPINNKNVFKYAVCFPFITLKVILLIHWHALLLYLKKIAFHAKESNPELQKGVYRAWVKK